MRFDPLTPLPPSAYRRRLHRFTVEEARALRAEGRLPAEPDIELIDGVIYEMPADGFRTIDWNAALNEHLVVQLQRTRFRVVPDKTLYLDAHNAPRPDFVIHDRVLSAKDVTGDSVALVIEVSDTTLADDLGVKAQLYARFGVREYWVVDVDARELVVHRRFGEGFAPPNRVSAQETVTALFVHGLTLRLDDLGVA
jgi:Uma2 family endonuclease